jgi:hypothetical protein
MKHLFIFAATALIVAALLAACTAAVSPDSGTRSGNTGKISISVNALVPPSGSSSRAVCQADMLRLTLHAADGSTSAETTWNAAVKGTWIVPSGTGYTVTARIWNTTVSATEPVVSGTSAPFTVTADETTAVSVKCIPCSPVQLEYEEEKTAVPLPEGGEIWYTFTARSSGTRVAVAQSVKKQIKYAVYDNTGAPAGIFSDEDPLKTDTADKTNTSSAETAILVATQKDAVYFIGITATNGANTVKPRITDAPQKTLTIDFPAAGSTITDPLLTVSGSCTGSPLPSTVSVVFSGCSATAALQTDGSWQTQFSAASAANGEKVLTVTAVWPSGISRTADRTLIYTGSPAVSGYTVSCAAALPAGYTITQGTLTLTVLSGTTAVSSCTLPVSRDTAAAGWTHEFTGISAGTYTIRAQAVDQEKKYTFTREKIIKLTGNTTCPLPLPEPDGQVTVSVS